MENGSRASDGRYRIVGGVPHLSGIVARLRKEVPLVEAEIILSAERRRREAADKVVQDALVTEDENGDFGVAHLDRLSVFKGLVDLTISDVTGSQAMRILDILRETK
jgi:hypothetical protein